MSDASSVEVDGYWGVLVFYNLDGGRVSGGIFCELRVLGAFCIRNCCCKEPSEKYWLFVHVVLFHPVK